MRLRADAVVRPRVVIARIMVVAIVECSAPVGRLFALERDEFLSLVSSGPDLSMGLLELYRGGTTQAAR